MRFDIWGIALSLIMLLAGEGVGQCMAAQDHSLAVALGSYALMLSSALFVFMILAKVVLAPGEIRP